MSDVEILKQSFGFRGLNTCVTELAVGFTRERCVNRHIKTITVINLFVSINFHEIT